MKIAFHNVYKDLNINDALFGNKNTLIGDDLLAPFVRIREYAAKKNIKVGTTDVLPVVEADAIVFVDMPTKRNKIYKEAVKSKKPIYLLTLESPIINPESFSLKNHGVFSKVFTWSDDLISKNPSKYIKINYSFDIPVYDQYENKIKEKFCTMIAANKKSRYPNELYSKRLEILKWFENYHPQSFDLYGMGWDSYVSSNTFINAIIKKTRILEKNTSPSFSCYKGVIERKKPILEKYKFAICYENVCGVPGYITEKIFDCFFSGCIPIYWGADNITDYIPSECFIDKKMFKSNEDLYMFMAEMREDDYLNYLNKARKFMMSENIKQFTNDFFSSSIINVIRNG